MITLAIDASTYQGTVAVIHDRDVLAAGEAVMRGRDAEALMPMVADTLARSGRSLRELSRIVCGSGPGSFTSLRIAASIAKGLALGVGRPLFAVSSLALLATGDDGPTPGRFLAVLDALRGEAYVGGYSVAANGEVSMIDAERLVRQAEVAEIASSLDAVTVGPGQTVDRSPNARAVAVVQSLIARDEVDLGSWEPRYGRKAEAQMRWESLHRRPLPFGGGP